MRLYRLLWGYFGIIRGLLWDYCEVDGVNVVILWDYYGVIVASLWNI